MTTLILFGFARLPSLDSKSSFIDPQLKSGHELSPSSIQSSQLHLKHTGDLDAILSSGQLRVLILGASPEFNISSGEKKLLNDFASQHQLNLEWKSVQNEWELITGLEKGAGDIILSSPDMAIDRVSNKVEFTIPWSVSRQQVISRRGSSSIKSRRDLLVRQVAAKKSSAAWDDLSKQASANLSMELIQMPENMALVDVLKKVSTSQYDLAVVDSLSVNDNLMHDLNLEVVVDLTDDVFVSWGVRHTSIALRKSLDQFLDTKHLESELLQSYREDLPLLKQRKLLRLITYRSPVNYYYEHGRLKGFEYELVKRFAESYNMRVEVVIANTQQEMQDMLVSGKGDVIAASLPESSYLPIYELRLTQASNYSSPVLVGRDDEIISDFRELEGRTIQLPAESPHMAMLKRIKGSGLNFSIVASKTNENTEAVLFRISQGIYDLTVIGSHEIKAEFTRQLNVKTHFTLTEPQPLVWAVRNTNTLLLSALNGFIEQEYRKGFYNVVYSKYIDNPNPVIADSSLLTRIDSLSPYDEIVHEYADRYSFDWRLIIAQMYQESLFDPLAVSYAGAEGLMQLLPGTAEMMGVKEITDPVSNISGGIRYLDYLRNLFEDDDLLEEHIWFTLAAYNAGYSRVSQARKLAVKMNLDSNRWFNNVEIAMRRLAKPYLKDGVKTRICRCGQTVVYVREIKTLYNNYMQLTQSIKAAANLSEKAEES